MYVKPGPGLLVLDPKTRAAVPAEGADVDETDLFWARRLADGDVVPADRPVDQPQS